jgi:hypothetical protein
MPDLTWGQINEGDEIPTLEKTPTAMQLFMFSASTWNRHLIHYNSEFAISDGLKNVAVHRALIGAFLCQMLTDWIGEGGSVENISWSVRGSAPIDRPILLRGNVVEKLTQDGVHTCTCKIRAENHKGETIAPGTAVVRLARP